MALDFQNEYSSIEGPDFSGLAESIGELDPEQLKKIGEGLGAPLGLLGALSKKGYDWLKSPLEEEEIIEPEVPKPNPEGYVEGYNPSQDPRVLGSNENYLLSAWDRLKGLFDDGKVTTKEIVPGFERAEAPPMFPWRSSATTEIPEYLLRQGSQISQPIMEQDQRNLLQRAWQSSRMGGGAGWILPNQKMDGGMK